MQLSNTLYRHSHYATFEPEVPTAKNRYGERAACCKLVYAFSQVLSCQFVYSDLPVNAYGCFAGNT